MQGFSFLHPGRLVAAPCVGRSVAITPFWRFEAVMPAARPRCFQTA
ncbi:hypothetical protein NEILACOT_04155 [Neisseria lactamica ATCC 23970]|uniref:Uncharacterized protein n=1 Tax=Neisseria lactamica ATCC 23970 TaxID=546265 RepID=D0W9E5_NEILA|nr:hypothetical protein NEILACOT_04155 [Neisseria lactamica ATCC 23970]